MVKQLDDFIIQEGVSNVHQFACRSLQFTETALLKIQNDIFTSLNSGKAAALTIVRFQASFSHYRSPHFT